MTQQHIPPAGANLGAGLEYPVTATMIEAAGRVFRGEHAPNRAEIAAALRAALQHMPPTAEPGRSAQTVMLAFTNHRNEIETIRLPVGGVPYDFGPRGLAFRKVQVKS